MSHTENQNETPENQTDTTKTEEILDDADAQSQTEGEENPIEEDPLETAKEQIESLQQDNMRLMAEMENLRKRTQKELADARKYAVSPLAKDLFTVSDNLGRALDAITDEQKENADPAIKNLIVGLEMVANDFSNAFDKNSIKIITPVVGDKFDVSTMQAMQEIASEDIDSGCIVQTLQPAYVLHERLLRPAMVIVAK